MTDLEIAKNELYEENMTLVIIKNGELLYSTKSHRISGFLDAIDKRGKNLEGASVADKVAGKAIALLCAYARVKEIYAAVMSRQALVVFKKHNIICHWNELVETILDANKTGMCPFEKAAESISDPEKVYGSFRDLRERFRSF
ncbi:MAG TPA: DUF1893 domain-containing protein [Candidatus Nanoarchaeia archaeon]|nr:DUF1893 domain-containing protein [Candidatus Nanoarchaeia archaeon]